MTNMADFTIWFGLNRRSYFFELVFRNFRQTAIHRYADQKYRYIVGY